MVEAIKLGKGMISESWEIYLKNIALLLGVLSVVAIILDWYPFTMFISLPFCLIWVYCGWLRTEPQLKWVNVIFCTLYLFGIVRYFFIHPLYTSLFHSHTFLGCFLLCRTMFRSQKILYSNPQYTCIH